MVNDEKAAGFDKLGKIVYALPVESFLLDLYDINK